MNLFKHLVDATPIAMPRYVPVPVWLYRCLACGKVHEMPARLRGPGASRSHNTAFSQARPSPNPFKQSVWRTGGPRGLRIPSVSGPLSPGVSKSQYRTTRWMTPDRGPGDEDGTQWPAQTIVLHRIEVALFTCIICNCPWAEYLHKMPDSFRID